MLTITLGIQWLGPEMLIMMEKQTSLLAHLKTFLGKVKLI